MTLLKILGQFLRDTLCAPSGIDADPIARIYLEGAVDHADLERRLKEVERASQNAIERYRYYYF